MVAFDAAVTVLRRIISGIGKILVTAQGSETELVPASSLVVDKQFFITWQTQSFYCNNFELVFHTSSSC
jgi:hypothetical protein